MSTDKYFYSLIFVEGFEASFHGAIFEGVFH